MKQNLLKIYLQMSRFLNRRQKKSILKRMERPLHHKGFSTALNKVQEQFNNAKQRLCKSSDIGS